jgi:oligopeptide/dipeptide ABC transporter ATP-binding protein
MSTELSPMEAAASSTAPMLRIDGVTVEFALDRHKLGRNRRVLRAVDDVSLTIHPGETLGLAGESGSGKSTLGYAVLGHRKVAAGSIDFEGQSVTGASPDQLRRLRRNMQMIFQDPYSSLNPRMKIGQIVGEPLVVHHLVKGKAELRERVTELLNMCGLPAEAADRYPQAFSGGQRQRVGIARALALHPKLIVADEPTSALDVSIQAQIVNLLSELQQSLGLSYLFISHNLAVLRQISHRIAVMYKGRIVECGPTDEIFQRPQHPYTRALLAAVPVPDPDLGWFDSHRPLPVGRVLAHDDQGCAFAPRCPDATDRCAQRPPLATSVTMSGTPRQTACWNIDRPRLG